MKRKLLIQQKPFSINAMSYRDKRYKTPEFEQWCSKILYALNNEKNQKALQDLRDYFDPNKHVYQVNLTFNYPHHILFTKASTISTKAHDLSNVEKPLIDLIFLPTFHKRTSNLNIDDKYILDLISRKRASEDHLIEVGLEVLDIDQFINIYDD